MLWTFHDRTQIRILLLEIVKLSQNIRHYFISNEVFCGRPFLKYSASLSACLVCLPSFNFLENPNGLQGIRNLIVYVKGAINSHRLR